MRTFVQLGSCDTDRRSESRGAAHPRLEAGRDSGRSVRTRTSPTGSPSRRINGLISRLLPRLPGWLDETRYR